MLRTLNFAESKTFECEGRKFALTEKLSFNRFYVLQNLILEFGFGAKLKDIYENLILQQANLNAMRFYESAIINHNMLQGIIKLDDKEEPALKIASLFINEEGEDWTEYDEAKTKDKINCWSKELDVLPFYSLAVSLVPAWITAFKHVSQNTLEVPKKES